MNEVGVAHRNTTIRQAQRCDDRRKMKCFHHLTQHSSFKECTLFLFYTNHAWKVLESSAWKVLMFLYHTKVLYLKSKCVHRKQCFCYFLPFWAHNRWDSQENYWQLMRKIEEKSWFISIKYFPFQYFTPENWWRTMINASGIMLHERETSRYQWHRLF